MRNLIIMFSAILMAQQVTQAQGIMYLSNLSQASSGSLAVGTNSWLAAGFQTGTNAGGYWLDSIQLAMTDASGNPSAFVAMLYDQSSDLSGFSPGSSLCTLNGSLNPVTGGIYTYTPASSLTLSPNTIYFIVLTAGTTVANGAYGWSYLNTASYGPVDNWGGGLALGSGNGLPWHPLGNYPQELDYPQYAINATAVPEPGVLSLFALGGLCFLWHRRRL